MFGVDDFWLETIGIFLADLPTLGLSLGPKLHPGVVFLGPCSFFNLKGSHQDRSNGGQTLFSVD